MDGDGDGDCEDGAAGSRSEVVLASSLLEADAEEEDGKGEEGGDAEELEWGMAVLGILPGLWETILGRMVFVLAIIVAAVAVVSLRVFAAAVLALLPFLGG